MVESRSRVKSQSDRVYDCELITSVQIVEFDRALGQNFMPGLFGQFLRDHRRGAGEKAVGMGIIGGPQNMVRAQVVDQMGQAAFDGLEGDPALALEIFARAHTQTRVIQEALVIEVTVHAVEPWCDPYTAGFEEGKAHLGIALAYAAPDKAQARQHHLERVRYDML